MNRLASLEEIVSSALLALMTVTIAVQVIFRYVISYSLDWPEELGRYLFIASVYIGSSYAEQKERHLAITILRTSGGQWCARYLPILVQLIVMAYCALMTVWGFQMAFFVRESEQVAPALQIPMYFVYLTIPLGMAGMCFRAFINLLKHCRGMRAHSETE